jgi:hypothetical protein
MGLKGSVKLAKIFIRINGPFLSVSCVKIIKGAGIEISTIKKRMADEITHFSNHQHKN